MEAAATAWNGLAAELRSAASVYGSVISELADESWTGPSSTQMAAAAAPYVAWLSSTAAEAEQTASQAIAAAAAYHSAFAMTVPPAEIAANRTQLAALVATNIYGQNTPAIDAVGSATTGIARPFHRYATHVELAIHGNGRMRWAGRSCSASA